MNNRRKFLVALGASALAAPFASFAQPQGKVWRVGYLVQSHMDLTDTDRYYGPFTRGMLELGYMDGKNLRIEWRSAEGKTDLLPGLAAELVQLKADVIVTVGTPATVATQKATTTIPIVMVGAGDPVGNGLVKSLARPGATTTGLSNMMADLSPKLLEMLLAMAPKVSRVAVLVNPGNLSNALFLKNVQAAAQRINVKIVPVEARSPQEIENAFSLAVRQNAKAIIVSLEGLFQQQKNQIVELAAKHRLPSIAMYGDYVEAGGLISYGANLREPNRRAATYVDKILKGTKPADLPIEQPTTLELFINGKTAKSLGLKIPQSLLISADKVIE